MQLMPKTKKWKTDEDQLHRLPGDDPVNEDVFADAAVEADFWQREGEFKLQADYVAR